jgi:hypothetical protein
MDKETMPASAGVVSPIPATGLSGGTIKSVCFRKLISRIDVGVSVGA